MKNLKQSITIGLLCFVVLTVILYAFFAFTKFDLSPAGWSEMDRLGFVLFDAIILLVSSVAGFSLYDYLNEKK